MPVYRFRPGTPSLRATGPAPLPACTFAEGGHVVGLRTPARARLSWILALEERLVTATARHFGVWRRTLPTWRNRFDAANLLTLEPWYALLFTPSMPSTRVLSLPPSPSKTEEGCPIDRHTPPRRSVTRARTFTHLAVPEEPIRSVIAVLRRPPPSTQTAT